VFAYVQFREELNHVIQLKKQINYFKEWVSFRALIFLNSRRLLGVKARKYCAGVVKPFVAETFVKCTEELTNFVTRSNSYVILFPKFVFFAYS
jgi:hypothetical protein